MVNEWFGDGRSSNSRTACRVNIRKIEERKEIIDLRNFIRLRDRNK